MYENNCRFAFPVENLLLKNTKLQTQESAMFAAHSFEFRESSFEHGVNLSTYVTSGTTCGWVDCVESFSAAAGHHRAEPQQWEDSLVHRYPLE